MSLPHLCGGRGRQKWGKREGLRSKLQANLHRLALPSLFLVNCQSLVNKVDGMQIMTMSRGIGSCVLVFVETWLDNKVPDAAIELASHSGYRADRTDASSKSKGGGVCI